MPLCLFFVQIKTYIGTDPEFQGHNLQAYWSINGHLYKTTRKLYKTLLVPDKRLPVQHGVLH